MAPIIVTLLANKPYRLWLAVRALRAVPVSGLLLLFLVMGSAVALSPVASEYLFAATQNESGPEDDDQPPVISPVAVLRSRKAEVGWPPIAVSTFSPRLKADALSRSPLLLPAAPVGAGAKLDGAGISMRC
jgi:hypothetical protein